MNGARHLRRRQRAAFVRPAARRKKRRRRHLCVRRLRLCPRERFLFCLLNKRLRLAQDLLARKPDNFRVALDVLLKRGQRWSSSRAALWDIAAATEVHAGSRTLN